MLLIMQVDLLVGIYGRLIEYVSLFSAFMAASATIYTCQILDNNIQLKHHDNFNVTIESEVYSLCI